MEFLALIDQIWEMIHRRWWLMLLPVAIAFILILPSLNTVLKPDTSYAVAMKFTAAAPADLAQTYEDSAYVPWLASEYVVVNLPQWITSDSFALEVSEKLAAENLEIAGDDLRPAFLSDAARSILVLYINWDDATEIEAIAHAAVDVLQNRNQVYFPQFAAQPAEVVALDDVHVTTVAPSLMTRFSPFLRLILAFMAGVGLAVTVELFDNTLRKPEDLENLAVVVMGVVPTE